MKEEKIDKLINFYSGIIYKNTAKILLRKLKNKEKLDKQDYRIMQIILEHVIRGNNEE